jgi:CRISPR-associated endonuclease/helicase Cas3
MGAGLVTSAQLDAFRRSFPVGKPCRSLWLSATLNAQWLATVDMTPHHAFLRRHTISKKDEHQARGRLNALKAVRRAPLELNCGNSGDAYLNALCKLVLAKHDSSAQTLVILNRVDRAQQLYKLLRAKRAGKRDLLIHARFRAHDRAERARCLRDESAVDRILVATQAVEAGLDISSKILVTELAPWSSLVQRFGRCNRSGEHNRTGGAQIVWIDIAGDAAAMLPYRADDLAVARRKLHSLKNAMPGKLPRTEEALPPTAVLRRKDLLDLFNTDPDLSGFDVDVSDYIRDTSTPGVQVFWREFERSPQVPTCQVEPRREELCPISMGQATGLQKRGAWYWDALDGEWKKLDRNPRPGMTLLLRAAEGAYDAQVGFDAALKLPVPIVIDGGSKTTEVAYGEDARSKTRFPVPLSNHLAHVARHARALCAAVDEKLNADDVVRASRWHDVGKAHAVFQSSMHSCEQAPKVLLAKSPCAARYERKYFRHEAASMLAWHSQNSDEPHRDLIAYLIVAHHGKMRMSLRAMPTETPAPDGKRFARGVWDEDSLPALEFDSERSAAITLDLRMMELGDGSHGPSWSARALKLLDDLGPFRLAWLESLVRLADWRASAEEQRLLRAAHR